MQYLYRIDTEHKFNLIYLLVQYTLLIHTSYIVPYAFTNYVSFTHRHTQTPNNSSRITDTSHQKLYLSVSFRFDYSVFVVVYERLLAYYLMLNRKNYVLIYNKL